VVVLLLNIFKKRPVRKWILAERVV